MMSSRGQAALAATLALGLTAAAAPAYAYNDGSPNNVHGACFSCGNATGFLPPPGLYFEETVQFGSDSFRNSSNGKTGTSLHFADSVPLFVWVPDVKIFGASAGIIIVPPVLIFLNASNDAGVGQTDYATANPAAIFALSWTVADGIAVSPFLAVTPDWGSRGVGNDFWSIAPGGAVSYVKDGWELTAWTEIAFNTEGSGGRTSGDYWYWEYTAARNFGYVTLGVVGDTNFQLTSDSGPGANSASEFGVGPYVEKTFGAAALKFLWTHDVYCQNLPCGDTFFLRVDAKLF